SRGDMGVPISFKQGNLEYTLFFGSNVYDLPFSIRLNDFIADKYPGTLNSFSSFMSEITLEELGENPFDYDIYMNHVLDHKGHRDRLASYTYSSTCLREAIGPNFTIFSVNHYIWGIWITSSGFTLQYMTMVLVMFDRNSRFGDLMKFLIKGKKKNDKKISVIA